MYGQEGYLVFRISPGPDTQRLSPTTRQPSIPSIHLQPHPDPRERRVLRRRQCVRDVLRGVVVVPGHVRPVDGRDPRAGA